jgi:hypothetical protein
MLWNLIPQNSNQTTMPSNHTSTEEKDGTRNGGKRFLFLFLHFRACGVNNATYKESLLGQSTDPLRCV